MPIGASRRIGPNPSMSSGQVRVDTKETANCKMQIINLEFDKWIGGPPQAEAPLKQFGNVGADVLRSPDAHRGVSKDRPESFDRLRINY